MWKTAQKTKFAGSQRILNYSPVKQEDIRKKEQHKEEKPQNCEKTKKNDKDFAYWGILFTNLAKKSSLGKCECLPHMARENKEPEDRRYIPGHQQI